MIPDSLGDIRVRVDQGVAELVLECSGDTVLSTVTALELDRFLATLHRERSVRSVLLSSSGRQFCIGADLQGDAGDAPGEPLEHRFVYEPYSRLFDTMWSLEIPVVTAVNGTVAGAGWLLALLGDLVVAADDARWIHAFVRRAMVPHAGDPYYLSRLVPFRRLTEIALLSDVVTSETLERWNVINLVLAPGEVGPRARELAQRLATGPTRSLGVTKALYRRALDESAAAASADERSNVALISTTKDRAEGIASFMERRDPEFTGE
ncbi:MAG: enoyl-CoA hydratase/isomerase family protein [Microthrixaceae bacterium]